MSRQRALRLCVVGAGLGLLVARGVTAEPSAITLEDVVSRAIAGSPEARALAAAATTLEGTARDEATRPAAILGASGQWPSGPRAGDVAGEYEVTLGQPLRRGDVNGERAGVAARAATAAQAEHAASRATFTAEVAVLFAELAALEAGRLQLERLQRQARGVVTRLESARTQTSLQASEQALLQAARHEFVAADLEVAARIDEARAALERRLGAPLPPGRLQPPPLPAIASTDSFVREVMHHAESVPARLDAQAALARARADLAHSERIGEVTPQVVYRRSDDGTDFIGFGIEIPLPVWGSTTSGERAGLTSAAASAAAAATAARSPSFERAVTGLARSYEQLRQRAEIHSRDVVPALERAAESAARELEAGQTSVGLYLQIAAQLRAAVLSGVAAYLDAVRVREELGVLRGQPL